MTEPSPNPTPFSFVIRLWAGRDTPLRGRIVRVGASGRDEGRAITRLHQIAEFVGEALEREGVPLGPAWRLRRWWTTRLGSQTRPGGGEPPGP